MLLKKSLLIHCLSTIMAMKPQKLGTPKLQQNIISVYCPTGNTMGKNVKKSYLKTDVGITDSVGVVLHYQ